MFEIDPNINNVGIEYNYNSLSQIPTVKYASLTYNDFLKNYMLPNIPCIIKGVTESWNSSKLWLTGKEPNFKYLKDKYGGYGVTVYKCWERYYNSQKSYTLTFSEYLKYFEACRNQNFLQKLEYLKNWHLPLRSKDKFYDVPILFASDWLNEYSINCLKDDYRFVYMGPIGSWTPFHVDVFMSYSWSANVCGKKRWLLFPPGGEDFLKDGLGNLPYDIEEEPQTQKCFDVIQDQGDAIFVPSGWYHQVWNLESTISINHNWVNGCNIKMMYESMLSHLTAVRKEIEDCRDMENYEEHCQLMLSTSFGMNFYEFYNFLKYISLSRINMKKGINPKIVMHNHQIGKNHILFDLRCIKNVLEIFNNREETKLLKYFVNVDIKPSDLLKQIIVILDSK
ncbi:hypothetical protein JTB14_010752 [Gonioctena quinquepunctata]|nr:hypothetical protein JTB14_010752 [Gonioctena quinquepunctata]